MNQPHETIGDRVRRLLGLPRHQGAQVALAQAGLSTGEFIRAVEQMNESMTRLGESTAMSADAIARFIKSFDDMWASLLTRYLALTPPRPRTVQALVDYANEQSHAEPDSCWLVEGARESLKRLGHVGDDDTLLETSERMSPHG